ncbi:Acetyl esterase [Pigmentiphaga humi]|uniref:Acetyl esterase n=1 Tax=Pigmentiphaga humi TaxID=2478468 RepID=A0A3P4AXB9_9BURK|nr:alpha/beta hydrolase fold domain-containing protein [Pigmentiphaga humi]VCU68714.1 Acetyl esterase [Pigmentiphaga humi]
MNSKPSIDLDPQLAAAQRLTDEMQAELGPPSRDIAAIRERAAELRKWWNRGGPRMARVIEASVPGPFRQIPIVVYVPEGSAPLRPAYVYLHGGGYKLGNQHANDRQMREIAEAWGGIVISADYVHVPEYRFPCAIEETAALFEWLSRHAEQWGIDGQRLAFGGSSAGANVSLGAAIQLGGEACGYLRAGALVVGTYGDRTTTESMRIYGDGALYPSRAAVLVNLDEYVPDAAMRADPRFDCFAADPSRFPPMFIAAAQYDVFRDASRAWQQWLLDHGRTVVFKEYPGMSHVFLGYSRMVDQAQACVRDIAEFLSQHLSPAVRGN